MRTDSIPLLSTTTHGIPSGNYDGSSLDFFGSKFKGVAYYNRHMQNTQSVLFTADDFVGVVTVQGTLDLDPHDNSSWFDLYTFPNDSTDGSTAISTSFSVNLTGNLSWVRVSVTDFTGGTIAITLSY